MKNKLNKEQIYEKKSLNFPNIPQKIKILLIASLSFINPLEKNISTQAQQFNTQIDLKEGMESNSQFKSITNAFSATFKNISHINQLPKNLYYKDMNITQAQAKGYPTSIDVAPKIIKEPLDYVYIIISKRVFKIQPLIGKIQNVYVTDTDFVIQTTLKDISYSKDEKLPALCYKLRSTPHQKGEKEGFWGSVVTEL